MNSLIVACLSTLALAQSDSSVIVSGSSATSPSSTVSVVLSGSNTGSVVPATSVSDYFDDPRATYASLDSTSSLSYTGGVTYLTGSGVSTTRTPQNQTITTNGTVLVTASSTQIFLTASSGNSTTRRTATSSSARPTNTQPCNGYPEFCNRKYSNITHIAAHNSPFDIQGNVASNQQYGVTTQLNDGVRMLQFQVHKPNASSPLLLCHTSCDLLNAGLLVDYLTEVREWLDQNPYDVLTILMGNYGYYGAGNFSDPVVNSGIERYLYVPPTIPMGLDQWPTLGEMIITQKRVVMMLDYDTNMTAMPWLLDEFSFMWETPFSPTERDFPCDVQRPPNQDRNISADRLYMANHNLNVAFSFMGLSLDIPAFTLLNETNAVTGFGSAGLASQNCTATWNRPPNFLLVDFYNLGSFNGSVFQVAADANGVSYDTDSCCGNGQRVLNAAPAMNLRLSLMVVFAGIISLLVLA